MAGPLPIDEHLQSIADGLKTSSVVVLEAAAGAGKTTRVPRFLVESGVVGDRQVVVAEPRRIAAKLAATYVAAEMGEPLGKRVGYAVRFEDKSSTETRIKYVTSGVLLRQLLGAPALRLLEGSQSGVVRRWSNVGAVVLDEFHERNLETDQAFALVKSLVDRGLELKLIVMSATLDADRLVERLGGCPRIRSEGRNYPLSIEHSDVPDDRALERRVASAVKRALVEQSSGHVLVFLPTVRDIERTAELLRVVTSSQQVDLLPLHGEMPLPEQARALAPSERRKVVLATNVAESSVTVPGVSAVVDSGLARIATYAPWSGRRELSVLEISRASAQQRAGRAGRTGPGRVYRLFSKASFQQRREQDLPEVQRADLSEAWLGLYGAKISAPERLAWLDLPQASAIEAAKALLATLGAVHSASAIELTPIGERMLRFGAHPRQARIIVAGEDLGVADDACLAAALLAERDILGRNSEGAAALAGGPSDLLQRIEWFREAEQARFATHRLARMGLVKSTVLAVDRAYEKWRHSLRATAPEPLDADDAEARLLRAFLTGFPDRVARRRKTGERDLILASGATAKLAETSVVTRSALMIALDLESRSGRDLRGAAVVPLASAIEPEWLLDDYSRLLESTESFEWNEAKSRVDMVRRIACGSVVLEESRERAPASPAAAKVLARALRAQKARFWGEAIETFCARVEVVAAAFPELAFPKLTGDDEVLLETVCSDLTGFDELEQVEWESLLTSRLDTKQQRHLREQAPPFVDLAGGRRLQVNYGAGNRPWVGSRLQDFFGMKSGPAICGGRTPLTLHLLAPNQRAVQVTTDLVGFWRQHYPALRRELMRRYPRHAWPEDPLTASPPAKKPR